jgi:hypothetical protein
MPKDWVKLKNNELMFCKRSRDRNQYSRSTAHRVGSAQVDNMTQYRDDMRNKSGKCTFGAGSGGAPRAGQ